MNLLTTDTTQIDQPDTPAAVFAARAFKSALFGTPSKRDDGQQTTRIKTSGVKAATTKKTQATSRPRNSSETPLKPQGILLTPGTATSKRKRVSFGRNGPAKPVVDLSRITELDEPTDSKAPMAGNESHPPPGTEDKATSSDEWEEEEDCSAHDVTTDLNEPHSQSGRYWKEEFLKYRQEARAEMEKLLKYKQLAKSYAQQKDAVAIELAEKLRDEQQRVVRMEKKIADNTSQIKQHRKVSGEDSAELLGKLNRQSALATEYRHRVQELEAQLKDLQAQREKTAGSGTPCRRFASSPAASVAQKTLTETRRELRRARSQLKEMDSLQDEVFALKMQLKKAELKLAVSEKEEARADGRPRAQELRVLLKAAKAESKQKDEEIRRLKTDLDVMSRDSEQRDAETKEVLGRAHDKIAELKKELKLLKSGKPDRATTTTAKVRTMTSDDASADGTKSKAHVRSRARRSLDETRDMDKQQHARPPPPPRTLRQKFMDDAAYASDTEPRRGAMARRATPEKPKWQPFVARSPRIRGHASEKAPVAALGSRGGDRFDFNAAPAKPAVGTTNTSHGGGSGSGGGRTGDGENGQRIDLLSDRFARLGGPGPNDGAVVMQGPAVGRKTSRERDELPAERRAAALAEIEKRMAEKKRLRHRSATLDKENIRP